MYVGLEETIRPESLRMTGAQADIANASWHCSSCFKSVAEMVAKIRAFSHTEYDQPQFREPGEIVRRVRNGLDLFDRDGELYEKVDARNDIPEYLKMNMERFAFLVDRDPPNANFEDYPPTATSTIPMMQGKEEREEEGEEKERVGETVPQVEEESILTETEA